MNLTPEERLRFAMWLEQEAATDSGLVAQMERLPSMAPMVAHRKREIEAHLFVARKLRALEESSLG